MEDITGVDTITTMDTDIDLVTTIIMDTVTIMDVVIEHSQVSMGTIETRVSTIDIENRHDPLHVPEQTINDIVRIITQEIQICLRSIIVNIQIVLLAEVTIEVI